MKRKRTKKRVTFYLDLGLIARLGALSAKTHVPQAWYLSQGLRIVLAKSPAETMAALNEAVGAR